MDIQKLPAAPKGYRIETGPMQFGDDWPGVFIRGDSASFDAHALERAIKALPPEMWYDIKVLTVLMKTLRSCSVGNTGPVTN
jgi:hypothetical protein